VKIGEYELDSNDSAEANKIITDFLNYTCVIINGDVSYNNGRSFLEDKQYRLNIDSSRYVGIKLRYDKMFRHENEFLVRDIRTKIGLANYGIKRINGFPMDSSKWRDGDCLISDWGHVDQKTDLYTLTSDSISQQDKVIFLGELGKNAALSYALGLWDRRSSNFVWDKNEKKIISIDHESISEEEIDKAITTAIANIAVKFFDANWYMDKELKLTFVAGFESVWSEIVMNRIEIGIIFDKYTIGKKESFLKRISQSSTLPLALIMMQ